MKRSRPFVLAITAALLLGGCATAESPAPSSQHASIQEDQNASTQEEAAAAEPGGGDQPAVAEVSSGPAWWTLRACPSSDVVMDATGVALPLASGAVTTSSVGCFYAQQDLVSDDDPYVQLSVELPSSTEGELSTEPQALPSERGCSVTAGSPLGAQLTVQVKPGASQMSDPCGAAREIFDTLPSESEPGPYEADYDNEDNDACGLLRGADLEAWADLRLQRDEGMGESYYQARYGATSFCQYDFESTSGSVDSGFVLVTIANLAEAGRDEQGRASLDGR